MRWFWAFEATWRLLGFHTSPKKGRSPTKGMVLLGAYVAIDDVFAQAEAGVGRVGKLKANVAKALAMGCLTPAEARELRGKQGFPSPSCQGDSDAA